MEAAKQGMIKIHGFKYLICLSSSLSLNLFFLYLIVDGQIELTWTKNAAFEAEEAASILCSGHGRAFIDGNVSRGGKKPTCECFSCYGGSDCSQFSPRCPADAERFSVSSLSLFLLFCHVLVWLKVRDQPWYKLGRSGPSILVGLGVSVLLFLFWFANPKISWWDNPNHSLILA